MTRAVLAVVDSVSIPRLVSFTLESAGHYVLAAVYGQYGLDRALRSERANNKKLPALPASLDDEWEEF